MKKKNKSFSVGATLALAAVFLVVCVATCVALLVHSSSGGLLPEDGPEVPGVDLPQGNSNGLSGGKDPSNTSDSSQVSVPLVRKENVYNILVVGRDVAGSNTDVIMVCSYDVKNGRMALMQIPRDSYVLDPINEGHTKKINAIYALAYNQAGKNGLSGTQRQKYALDYLEGVVEDTFALTVDRYVYIDLKAFRQIVNIIGGVTVDVPADMDYDDAEQNLHIHIKKGKQKLNGAQAEGFVRFRKGYLEGDLGRLDAQKLFLSALLDQLLSPSNLTKIPQLMKSAYEYMVTDLSLSDVTYFASSVGSLNTSSIFMLTAPGEAFRTEAGAWYYSLYQQESLEAVNQYFNCYTTDMTADRMSLKEMSHVSTDAKGDVSSADDLVKDPPHIPLA